MPFLPAAKEERPLGSTTAGPSGRIATLSLNSALPLRQGVRGQDRRAEQTVGLLTRQTDLVCYVTP